MESLMNKIVTLILTFVFALSFVACEKEDNNCKSLRKKEEKYDKHMGEYTYWFYIGDPGEVPSTGFRVDYEKYRSYVVGDIYCK